MYAQPANCLYVRRIYSEASEANVIPSEYIKHLSPVSKVQAISTDVVLAWAEFTYKVTDPNLFSPKFIESFSYRMGAALAQPLTGNIQLGQTLLNMSMTLADKAMLLNKREESLQKPNYSSLIESR
jgi:hypothetical protein